MNVKYVGISSCSYKSYPSHNHPGWEILLNLEGSGKTFVEDKEFNFCPGSIICIPPFVFHSKVADNTFRDAFIEVKHLPLPTNNKIAIFSDDEKKSIEKLILMAHSIYHKKEFNYEAITDNIASLIYQFLLSWGEKKARNINVELYKNELINHFTDPEYKISYSLKSISYSNDHFRRCFKADTGVTPTEYLINLRIEYAKQLLLQKNFSNKSISEISYFSGFSDPNYFSRIFKKNVGMGPKEFAEASYKS